MVERAREGGGESSGRGMIQCVRCMAPNSLPIELDSHGVCEACRTYAKPSYRGLEALKEEVEKYRNGSGSYDCIVPMSGGKDSTYVAYLASRMLGLRVLGVSYDSGLRHPVAGKNMERVRSRLGIDVRYIRSRHGSERAFLEHFLKAMEPIHTYWGICIFCHYAIEASVYRTALKEGVPLVLWGNTHHENLRVGMEDKYRKLFQAVRGFGMKERLRFAHHMCAAACHLLRLRFDLYLPPVKNLFTISTPPYPPKQIQVIRVFLSYLEWNPQQIFDTLKREIGWESPEAHDATQRFDCLIEPLVNHNWRSSYGVSTRQVISSNLYRANMITRDELERAYRTEGDRAALERDMEIIYRALGLKRDSE